jgi:hypothetical protein
MRDFLLSLASPDTLSWIGFLLLATGLLGEVAVLVEPFEAHWTHKPLGFAFAAVVLVGYVVGHIGDDATTEKFAARATKAEQELHAIKTPRTLPSDKLEKLKACLQTGAKGKVYIRPAIIDTDGPLLAKQLETAFKDAGYDVLQWPQGDSLAWSQAGIFLIVHQLAGVPPHISAVQKCLFEIGIEALGEVDPSHPEDAVSIAIGPRI